MGSKVPSAQFSSEIKQISHKRFLDDSFTHEMNLKTAKLKQFSANSGSINTKERVGVFQTKQKLGKLNVFIFSRSGKKGS